MSGISTSILLSSFESWMICEHFSRGYSEKWLDYTLYIQSFANGITAIISGILGYFTKIVFNSFIAPFDLAIILLLVNALFIHKYWNENYGNSNFNHFSNFITAFKTLKNDSKIIYLGISQSFFEASMYCFVFMYSFFLLYTYLNRWTPTLEKVFGDSSTIELPHGLIFACFMVCIMIGSSIFKLISNFTTELILLFTLSISSSSLLIPIIKQVILFIIHYLYYFR